MFSTRLHRTREVDAEGHAPVTGITLHKDLVPRLSIHALFKMREDTLRLLATSKVSECKRFEFTTRLGLVA